MNDKIFGRVMVAIGVFGLMKGIIEQDIVLTLYGIVITLMSAKVLSLVKQIMTLEESSLMLEKRCDFIREKCNRIESENDEMLGDFIKLDKNYKESLQRIQELQLEVIAKAIPPINLDSVITETKAKEAEKVGKTKSTRTRKPAKGKGEEGIQ